MESDKRETARTASFSSTKLENATHPKTLANLAKHFAFTRCGELNLNGMVETLIAVLESDLLADNALVS